MFFAEELPTSLVVPQQAVIIVIVFGVLLFVLNIVAAIVVILASAKRKPSIESEFATKAELQKSGDGLKAEMVAGFARVDADLKHFDGRNEELAKGIFAKVESISTSMSHEFSSLNRSMGRLEGTQDLAKAIAGAIKQS